jgi:polysaccharide deacetylase family protein (PEP-CTERM system associated)
MSDHGSEQAWDYEVPGADRRAPELSAKPIRTAATDAPRRERQVARADRTPHIITVALEDYYNNFKGVIDRAHWSRFETRVEASTLRTLDLLDEFGIRATFFGVGWIASRIPEVFREVARRGHEVASKGYGQRAIAEMSPEEFREDLARAREALEAACGQRVVGYRAPGWLRAADLWALEVLAEDGYAYDSSIKPIFYPRPSASVERFAHSRYFGDHTLWEFPISTIGAGKTLIPIGAGNYFRQLPDPVIRRAVAHWDRRYPGAPFVMYFHTWELDPEQPQITAAPLLNRIRKYRNLKKVPEILRRYFGRHQFTCIGDYLGLLEHKPVRSRPDVVRHIPVIRDADRFLGAALSSPTRADGKEVALPLAGHHTAGHGHTAGRAHRERTRITLVVPCYNEEHSLPYLANTLGSVREVLAPRYDVETIFVDDNSGDRTWGVLEQLFGSDPHATRLRHETNRGVAASILTGLRHAQTEIVCSIDCDCSYDPHDLANMIPLLREDVALVTASPYHPKGHVYNVPVWRLSLSKSLSRIYRLVLRQPLHTYTSCFRVYRRRAVIGIEPERGGFLGIAELIGKLALSGATIVEHPATLEVRVLGHSKMKILHTIAGHLALIAMLARRRTALGRTAVRADGDPARGAAAPAPAPGDLPHA